ncbi:MULTISPECIES: hypothetical protein [unclassified Oceanobacillus]|uniref:hypothetical protein n=1 Tax=unclassified Oceanobacillus TaxID=2630292 RepID=UPI00300DC562
MSLEQLFSSQFLLVSILDYHYEGDKKIIHEVASTRPIQDEFANKESYTKEGTMVYQLGIKSLSSICVKSFMEK